MVKVSDPELWVWPKGGETKLGTGVEQMGLRCFLNEVTEEVFLVWKGEEFQRTGA